MNNVNTNKKNTIMRNIKLLIYNVFLIEKWFATLSLKIITPVKTITKLTTLLLRIPAMHEAYTALLDILVDFCLHTLWQLFSYTGDVCDGDLALCPDVHPADTRRDTSWCRWRGEVLPEPWLGEDERDAGVGGCWNSDLLLIQYQYRSPHCTGQLQ